MAWTLILPGDDPAYAEAASSAYLQNDTVLAPGDPAHARSTFSVLLRADRVLLLDSWQSSEITLACMAAADLMGTPVIRWVRAEMLTVAGLR